MKYEKTVERISDILDEWAELKKQNEELKKENAALKEMLDAFYNDECTFDE